MSPRETVTLPKKDLSGSRLRCLILTSMPRVQVASVLTELAAPFAAVDPERDVWAPGGFLDPEEAKLGECERFLAQVKRQQLTSWWLKEAQGANTPNWDMVSTCTIEGTAGLIIVEAKAHDDEAKEAGKPLGPKGNPGNHEQIGAAITEANRGLNEICPGWAITRDSHYQLCDRFAWTWKIASLGVPVILVYLGFLRADEMARRGKPFACGEEWRSLVIEHATNLVPTDAWEKRLQTNGAPMWATIRSLDLNWVVSEGVFA